MIENNRFCAPSHNHLTLNLIISNYRVDKEFFLGNLDKTQAKQMFRNFYPSTSEDTMYEMLSKFERINGITPVSPAALENYISRCDSGSQEALDNLDSLENIATSNEELGDNDKTIVYRFSRDERKWVTSGRPRAKQSWETALHEKETKEKLLNDVNLFLRSRNLYQLNGIPYRRGYLFHGPHGTGKLSMVHCLAGKLNYSIASLDLTEKDLTIACLKKRLENVPGRCLILIENLDEAFCPQTLSNENKETPDEKEYKKTKADFSLSDFCNIIDSLEVETSPILIMIAKNQEGFDAKLLHPGR